MSGALSYSAGEPYESLVRDIAGLLERDRRAVGRAANAIITATYWEIGLRIVNQEQGGALRAVYGEELLKRLSVDLTTRFGRGFSVDNLEVMRLFYLAYPEFGTEQPELASGSKSETLSRISDRLAEGRRFPLSWSHYVLLLRRTRRALESRTALRESGAPHGA